MAGRRADPFSRARTHEALLRDRVRTLAYKAAIEAHVRPGDVVLDLGCGTGLFSLLAARRGCRKVYAVDRSPIIDAARGAARDAGLDGRIEFIRSSLADLDLPEKADVIVHELIGSRFWDEDLLAAVARARARHLAPGGRLLPYRLDVFVVPTSHVSDLERSLAFWKRRRYGVDLAHFGRLAFEQGVRDALAPTNIALRDERSFLAQPKRVLRLDLRTADRLPDEVRASFRLARGSRLSGLCAFLRVHLDARRSFTTGPQRAGTHWGVVFLPAFEPRVMAKTSRLEVTLSMAVKSRDWRWTMDVRPGKDAAGQSANRKTRAPSSAYIGTSRPAGSKRTRSAP